MFLLLQVAQDGTPDQEAQAHAAQDRCACALRHEQGGVRVGDGDNNAGGSDEQGKASQREDARCVAVSGQRQRAQRLRLGEQAQRLDSGQREAGLLGCEGGEAGGRV